jgi:hypothetical protein
MRLRAKIAFAIFALLFSRGTTTAVGQQKPQWMPGQVGLNAGILPSPGITYANITANYDANTYNAFNGKAVPAVGTYDAWAGSM